jgi:hypothetical protein
MQAKAGFARGEMGDAANCGNDSGKHGRHHFNKNATLSRAFDPAHCRVFEWPAPGG